MEINKKELKKISKKLSTLTSNVIRAHYREQNDALLELINFVDETDLLINYINSLKCDIEGFEDDVNNIAKSYGRQGLDLGSDSGKKLYLLYNVFKYILDKDISTYNLGWFYSGGNHYQDMAKAFGDELVYKFYSIIELYLSEISIDMGYDEDKKHTVVINGSGVQIVLAEDNSTVNAVQNNSVDMERLNKKIEEVKQLINTLEDVEQRDTLISNIDIISEEVKKPESNKAILKNAFNNLKFIANGISKLPDLIAGIILIGKMLSLI